MKTNAQKALEFAQASVREANYLASDQQLAAARDALAQVWRVYDAEIRAQVTHG